MDYLYTTTDLTWAAPINITDLCSSLAAWYHTKKVATTLHLCHQLGTGPPHCPKPPVTKLPREITEMIIQELFNKELAIQRDQWETFQACAECRSHDHPSDWRRFAYPDLDLIPEDMYAEAVRHVHTTIASHETTLTCQPDGHFSESALLCSSRRWLWSKIWASPSGFPILDEILRKDFGLAVLIVRQNGRSHYLQRSLTDLNEMSRNFIPQAYIVPRRNMHEEEVIGDFHAEETIHDTIGGSMGKWAQSSLTKFVDPSLFFLSTELTKRFREALRKLQIVPRLNDAQIVYTEPDVLPEWDLADKDAIRKRLEDEVTGEWPKLMNLVQVTVI